MIILSVKENNNKLHYTFTSENHEGVNFNILVEYGIAEEDGETFFYCDYEELEHTKNNKKEEIEDSKIVCDVFTNSIADDLWSKLKKGELSVNS